MLHSSQDYVVISKLAVAHGLGKTHPRLPYQSRWDIDLTVLVVKKSGRTGNRTGPRIDFMRLIRI
jgi:hypothetical protein